MPVTFDRLQIQNLVRSTIVAGAFYAVSQNPTTRLVSADTSATVTPSSVVVNEIASDFRDAENYRRSLARERSGWEFQALVDFDREVIAEKFEEAWNATPPRLARDIANGRPFDVWLFLTRANYGHPTQQESSQGSHINYTIEARLTPR